MSTPTQPAKRAKKGGWKKIAGIAAGSLLALFIISGLIPKPVEVETGTVIRGPLTVTVLEEGKTRIRNRYIISPPIAGYLKRIPLRAGDPVVQGETVVATIEASPATFLDPRARAQAEAAVQSAEAARMQRNEQVSSASAELDLARKELARAATLRQKGAISVQEHDAATNRVDMLSNQLGSAQFAAKVAEFELQQAKAALLQYEDDGKPTGKPLEIRAPVSGYVLNVIEESARSVTPGLPLMEIGDPIDLEAEIELLSSDAVGVKPGASVKIEQWGGDQPLEGRVILVEPGGFMKVSALGVEEQRVKVRVNFTNLPEGKLGDRYRVEARIETWHDDNVLQLPTGALFRRGNTWMTFVIEGGKARAREVEIGPNNGLSAVVKKGLTEGEIVILHPSDAIANGTAVRARPHDEAR